ncbi:MAG TPA: MFS transporter [Gaiellaceae bacterium]|nr:MFS transporter [Gaiellaceae bacterium]
MVLAGFNLRIAVVIVPPVIDEIQRDLDLSSAAAGLLTAVPVLCFGLLAPAVPALTRRFGAERLLVAAFVPITLGVLLRGAAFVPALFLGTVVAGAGIAIGNVVVPVVVRARFGSGTGPIMGVYVAAMGVGAAVAAGLMVPITRAFDGRWSAALAIWAVPALVAAGLLARDERPAAARGGIGDVRTLLRDPLAWQVTLFMGLQSLVFYTGLAWLPSILRDEGYNPEAAGLALTVYALAGIPASLIIPVLAARMRDQRGLAVLATALDAVAIAGLIVAPGAAFVWVVVYALGQGSAFGLALTLIVLRSPDERRTSELSALAQSVGYTIAAAGPFAFGAVHDATDGWRVPLAVLLVCIAPMLAAGIGAGRARTVATGLIRSER